MNLAVRKLRKFIFEKGQCGKSHPTKIYSTSLKPVKFPRFFGLGSKNKAGSIIRNMQILNAMRFFPQDFQGRKQRIPQILDMVIFDSKKITSENSYNNTQSTFYTKNGDNFRRFPTNTTAIDLRSKESILQETLKGCKYFKYFSYLELIRFSAFTEDSRFHQDQVIYNPEAFDSLDFK